MFCRSMINGILQLLRFPRRISNFSLCFFDFLRVSKKPVIRETWSRFHLKKASLLIKIDVFRQKRTFCGALIPKLSFKKIIFTQNTVEMRQLKPSALLFTEQNEYHVHVSLTIFVLKCSTFFEWEQITTAGLIFLVLKSQEF